MSLQSASGFTEHVHICSAFGSRKLLLAQLLVFGASSTVSMSSHQCWCWNADRPGRLEAGAHMHDLALFMFGIVVNHADQLGAVPWNLDHPDFFDDFLMDLPEPRAGPSASMMSCMVFVCAL